MRKIALSLLCAGTLINAPTMAMEHRLTPGVMLEYELPANSPELLTNFTIFTIHAICKLQIQDESNIIHIRAVNRSSQVNGQVITAGDELDLIVHNGETFDIIAEPATQVELTNIGEHTIKAKCQLA